MQQRKHVRAYASCQQESDQDDSQHGYPGLWCWCRILSRACAASAFIRQCELLEAVSNMFAHWRSRSASLACVAMCVSCLRCHAPHSHGVRLDLFSQEVIEGLRSSPAKRGWVLMTPHVFESLKVLRLAKMHS